MLVHVWTNTVPLSWIAVSLKGPVLGVKIFLIILFFAHVDLVTFILARLVLLPGSSYSTILPPPGSFSPSRCVVGGSFSPSSNKCDRWHLYAWTWLINVCHPPLLRVLYFSYALFRFLFLRNWIWFVKHDESRSKKTTPTTSLCYGHIPCHCTLLSTCIARLWTRNRKKNRQ